MVAWDGVTTLGGETRTLVRRRERGEVMRIRPRVYLDVDTWAELPPWRRYGLVCAALAASKPWTVFVGPTAAYLHGVGLPEVPPEIHVQLPLDARARRHPSVTDFVDGARGRQRWGLLGVPGDVAPVGVQGLRVAPLATVVESLAVEADLLTAATAIDALRHSLLGMGAAEAELLDAWIHGRSDAAAARIRRAWDASDALAESPLESAFRVGAVRLGFARPQLQLSIGPYRVDAAWPGARLVAECDGAAKYGATAEEQVLARTREREREEYIKAQGFHVFRVTWDDVADLSRLRLILSGNGVPLAEAHRPRRAA